MDINAVGNDGKSTILLETITDSKRLTPEFLEFLLSHGASLKQKAPNGKTAYDIIMECCSDSEIKKIATNYWKIQNITKK